jgi:hypothetical protein
MIRPITVLCFLLACGSGLYLYQTKHRVQVLDRQIEDTVRATGALREQARVLHAQWTLMNDPQRLQVLADQFLNLKTVAPGQFTGMADLDSRLPAVKPPEPPPAPLVEIPVAQAAEPASQPVPPVPQPEQPVPAPTAFASPPPPPAPKPSVVAAAAVAVSPHPAEHRLPPVHAAVAETPPVRPVATEVAPRPRPIPVSPHPVVAATMSRPVLPTPSPFAGSALGMARSASVSVPVPTPVSASKWVNNGNGGG